MAERRMLAKTIITSDAFTEMPQSSQLLYFYLSMQGDDDGFVNNPKSIMRNAGCKDDDMRILAAKKFIIPFESGIVVIKHWKIHNYIAKDRYTETKYKVEKARLQLDENGAYTKCIQDVDGCETQVRLGEVSIGKDSEVKVKKVKTPFTPPTLEECIEYGKEKQMTIDCAYFHTYYSTANWLDVEGKQVQNWKLKMLTWQKRENDKNPPKKLVTVKSCSCGGDIVNSRCKDCGQIFDAKGEMI